MNTRRARNWRTKLCEWSPKTIKRRGPTIKHRRLIWSARAHADLYDIARYIAIENPKLAKEFILDLDQKIRSLARLGLTGVSREELGKDIRSFAYRQRVIYFRASDDAIFVLRVLHGHRNISTDDFSENNN